MKKLLLGIFFLSCVTCASAQEIATKDDLAKFGMAQSYNNLKQYSQSLPVLKDLYARYPENKAVALEYAKALGYSKELANATRILDALNSKYPKDKDVLQAYATVLESNEQFSRATDKYLELAKLSPKDDDLKLKLAQLYAWSGDYQKALEYLQDVSRRRKGDDALQLQIADVYFWSRDYQKAIEGYTTLEKQGKLDDARLKNLGLAHLESGNAREAAGIYKKYLATRPDDIEAQIDLVVATYAIGDNAQAKAMLDEIIAHNLKDAKIILKLIDILANQHRYVDAYELCAKILEQEPDNKMAMLWQARVRSWERKYDESLKLYDKVIDQYPDWAMPRREKARVLGWMRQYKKSVDAYKVAEKMDTSGIAGYEMRAKRDYYRRFYRNAIKGYKEWLLKEPNDLEALFDLAQSYSTQAQWVNAQKTYDQILRVNPTHFRAKEALDKVNILADDTLFHAGYEWYEADSSSRLTDVRYQDVFASFKPALTKRLSGIVRQDGYFYEFRDLSSVKREKIMVGAEYKRLPYWWFDAAYAYSNYSDKIKSTHNYRANLMVKPLDALDGYVLAQRTDIIENSQTLRHHLQADDYKGRLVYRPNRRLVVGGDYMFSNYNDGNEKRTYGVDITSQLLYEPRSLTMFYRYEEYGFTQSRDYYFTPHSFHQNIVGFEWRHYLNKEELFWGTNDTYYTFRYSANFDTDNQHGHNFYVDFYKDWNKRFATVIEYSKKLYEHRDTYSEDRLMAYIKYYF